MFADSLRELKLGLSGNEIETICEYGIKGSERRQPAEKRMYGERRINLKKDLIHVGHFVESLDHIAISPKASKVKEKGKMKSLKEEEHDYSSVLKKKEQILVSKIKTHFQEKLISFYDCFELDEQNK